MGDRVSNLLVVDWDFFFYDPIESGDFQARAAKGDRTWQLWDWSRAESDLFIDSPIVWPDRAAAFTRNGLDLPMVDVPADWWRRFNVTPDARYLYADSNAYAGSLAPTQGGSFDHVYLFDAHHDCYGVKTSEQLDELIDGSTFTCENWMFLHHVLGSELHWRWPQWHTTGSYCADYNVPDWLELDADCDDGQPFDNVEFDTVFVCRSGAWVPPWCDEHFAAFQDEFSTVNPGASVEFLEPTRRMIRDWEEDAKAVASAFDLVMQRIKEKEQPCS